MNRLRVLVLSTTLSLLAGCASATTQNPTGRAAQTQLTRSELMATNEDNLYDAINRLRPTWLTTRGATSVSDSSPSEADVYMNGTLLGKSDYLHQVRLQDVSSVTYYDAGRASARFGMGHPRGVIEIVAN